MRLTLPHRITAAGLLALTAAACADPATGPSSPSLIIADGAGNVGDVVAADHGRGLAVLCSYGSNGNFTVVTSVGGNFNVDVSAGTCQIVANLLADVNDISVTMNLVSGQAVTNIDITTGTANTKNTYPTSVVGPVSISDGSNVANSIYGLENGTLIEFTSTLTPPPPPPGGGEGCTPGYWKQSHHWDSWVGYSPGDQFNTVFGVNAFPGMTLVQVAGQGGGGLKALGRHTVAALLNASSGGVDYDLTTAQVIAAFQAAFASGDYEGQKDIFAGFNEQGCPLN